MISVFLTVSRLSSLFLFLLPPSSSSFSPCQLLRAVGARGEEDADAHANMQVDASRSMLEREREREKEKEQSESELAKFPLEFCQLVYHS